MTNKLQRTTSTMELTYNEVLEIMREKGFRSVDLSELNAPSVIMRNYALVKTREGVYKVEFAPPVSQGYKYFYFELAELLSEKELRDEYSNLKCYCNMCNVIGNELASLGGWHNE